MVENWNLAAFHWLNASASAPFLVKWFAILTADALIYVLALWMVIKWIRSRASIRVALLYSGITASLGLAANQIMGLIWYHPRPFEMGVGNALMSHVVETSFPSDHAVVLFCIGFALLWVGDTRRWGVVITVLGLFVAWSRVYLGVHFPLDMLGSFTVSMVAVSIVHKGLFLIERYGEPSLTRLYDWIVNLLNLPKAWFPTRGHVGS